MSSGPHRRKAIQAADHLALPLESEAERQAQELQRRDRRGGRQVGAEATIAREARARLGG